MSIIVVFVLILYCCSNAFDLHIVRTLFDDVTAARALLMHCLSCCSLFVLFILLNQSSDYDSLLVIDLV